MSADKSARSEEYKHLRDEFDGLKIEDKAMFLVEAGVSTLLRGIEEVVHTISDEFERAFRRAETAAAEAEAEAAAAEAEAAAADAGAPAPNVTPETTDAGAAPGTDPFDLPGEEPPASGPIPPKPKK